MNVFTFLLGLGCFAFLLFLHREFVRLRNRVEEGERRLRDLERALPREEVLARSATVMPRPVAVAVAVAPPPLARPPAFTPTTPELLRPVPIMTATAGPAPRAAGTTSSWDERLSKIDWERFMGVRLFAWLGGLALFLAVAYFVKYSFERNLIPPSARVAIGLMTGLGLAAGGLVLRRREYAVTAQTLCATGVVVLYASLFAGHALYQLPWLPQFVTFTLMTAVTGGAFLLAVRMPALVVAVLGLVGGFLTPVLLSTGRDQPLALFTYIALLDLGLLAVALHKRWDFLAVLGAVGTVLLQIGWAANFFTIDRLWTAWLIFAVFLLLFTGAVGAANWRKHASNWLAGAVGIVAFGTLGFVSVLIANGDAGDSPGPIFAIVLVADLALLAVAWWQPRLNWLHLAAGMVSFGCLTLWQGRSLAPELLYWALGLSLAFAALHVAFPLVLRRWRMDAKAERTAQVFPAVALATMLVPLLKLPQVSFALWPTLLLLSLLALGLAAWAGGIVGAVAALVLTGIASAVWMGRFAHGDAGEVFGALAIVGVTAVVFAAAGAAIAGRSLRRTESADGEDAGPAGALDAMLTRLLPVFAVLMPFLLLSQLVVQLQLPEPSGVFAVALLMIAMLLALTLWLRFDVLPLAGLAALTLLQSVWWLDELGATARPLLALAWCLATAACIGFFPVAFRRALDATRLTWIAAAVAFVPAFHVGYRLMLTFWPNDVPGLMPLAFAIPPAATLAWLLKTMPRSHELRNERLAWFGGVTLFFLTVALPIQFERQWLTLGLAIEGAALLWLFRRVPHPGLPSVGGGLLVAAFVRLILNPAVYMYAVRSETPLWNWWLYTYGLAAAASFVGARLLTGTPRPAGGFNLRALLTILGTVLLFALVNLEIADFFTAPGERIQFEFSGNFGRDMTYTIAWSVFALGLVIAGLARGVPAARWAGLGLLAFAAVKLFFHDLARLEQLYRIGALFGVALVAFAASVLYQRFVAREDKARAT